MRYSTVQTIESYISLVNCRLKIYWVFKLNEMALFHEVYVCKILKMPTLWKQTLTQYGKEIYLWYTLHIYDMIYIRDNKTATASPLAHQLLCRHSNIALHPITLECLTKCVLMTTKRSEISNRIIIILYYSGLCYEGRLKIKAHILVEN